MARYSPSPISFSFMTPPKPLMEFKGLSSPDTRPEDVYSKCDLCTVLLYTYEWTISNFSMIKPISEPLVSPVFSVGPCKNLDLKLLVTSTSDDSIKIEVLLLKETKLTEEMKGIEANCPLTSKLTKHILGLEYLDNNGKRIDYYKSLPYEFKYINTSKVYAWTKEDNVARFIHNDSVTIRAKLSMRFYTHSPEREIFPTKKTTKVLMNDMKNLFNERDIRFPDILIKVGGQYVPCHKSILYSQCPCFAEFAKIETGGTLSSMQNSSLKLPSNISNMISNNCDVLHILNESADVFLSVLHFIYSKTMQASEAVDDFAVYEFAKKYGVRDLSMLLMPTEKKVHSQIIVKKLNYTWYVKKFSSLNKGGFSPTQSPEFKTKIGNEVVSWSVILFCLDAKNVILNLQRINGLDADVQTLFRLGVYKADGSIYDEREFKHLFTSGTIKNCHPGFMESVSRFCITPDLLYNDTLAVCCDLTVSCGELSSDIKYIYPSEYPTVDITYWTSNFHRLFESESFSDATLIVEGKEFRIHRALLAARSPVFARMFESDMEEKRSGCVRIEDASSTVMKQALYYIYTGKIDDLTLTHAPELYSVADKYEIMDLKSRCSEFMVKNLDAESACEILIIADLHNDEKLKEASKNVICRNAAQALLSPHGVELMANHSPLAQDILETLSAVFCSLPPQDAILNSSKRAAASVEDSRSASFVDNITLEEVQFLSK